MFKKITSGSTMPTTEVSLYPKISSSMTRTLLLCVAIMLVFFVALVIESYRGEQERSQDIAKQSLSVFAEHAAKVMETQVLILDSLSQRVRDMNWEEIARSRSLHDDLNHLVERLPQVRAIWLTDASGIIRNESMRWPIAKDVSMDPFFVRHRNGILGTLITPTDSSSNTGSPQFIFSRDLQSSSGRFNGVLALSLSPSYFENLYSASDPNKDLSVSLVLADGHLLASYPNNQSIYGRLPNDDLFYTNILSNALEGSYRNHNSTLDPTARRFYYKLINGYPLYVLLATNGKIAYAHWRMSLIHYALLTFLPAFGFVLFAHLSGRREAQTFRALRNNEERFRTLYNNTPIALDTMDENGRFVSVSDRWITLMGYGRDEICNTYAHDLVVEEDRDIFDRDWNLLLKTGSRTDYSVRYLAKNGNILDLLASNVVERKPNGEFVRVIGCLVDVTSRRKTEEALRRSQKMEVLGKLTGGVAHDFNNILAVIVGNAELARSHTDVKGLQLIGRILDASHRAETLTRQLLSFSRRNATRPRRLDLHEEITRIMEMIGPSLRGDILVTADIPKEGMYVKVDLAEFEIAILNIAVNARDAMPRGGALHLKAKRIHINREELSEFPDLSGDFIRLDIIDNGEGISVETARKAFEPFFTTKGIGSGTGLGLSQVYGFAVQSSGGVTISPMDHQGTRVSLYLPFVQSEDEIAVISPSQIIEGKGQNILLVDDNTEVADVTADVLRALGYQVQTSNCPSMALTILRQSDIKFDLLISDIVMPGGMNGVEFAQLVRSEFPLVAILLMSGYSSPDIGDIEFDKLTKPVRHSELSRAVHKAISNVHAKQSLEQKQ
jgi:PAS domain S-box-containing protein